jgi:DMSO/TMAO reductase YedYZ molybdopterin-dependent catalytic subunit
LSPPPEPAGKPYGRGAFLLLVAGGLSSLAWASPALRLLDSLLPSGARKLLPSQGWRIYTIGDSMPRFDPRSWRLRIDGLVAKPRELGYEELLRLRRAEQTSDFHCVTGWTVKDVRWAGVRFHDLLALAQPLPQAHALRFVSAEHPYEDALTLDQALRQDALLAYEMDGRPLSRPHGAPARVVLPAMYGYKNVKWVERIELVAHASDGFWEKLGYDRNAWVGRTNGNGA